MDLKPNAHRRIGARARRRRKRQRVLATQRKSTQLQSAARPIEETSQHTRWYNFALASGADDRRHDLGLVSSGTVLPFLAVLPAVDCETIGLHAQTERQRPLGN